MKLSIGVINVDSILESNHLSASKRVFDVFQPKVVIISDLRCNNSNEKNAIETFFGGYKLLTHPDVSRTGILFSKSYFNVDVSKIVDTFYAIEDNTTNLTPYRSKTCQAMLARLTTNCNKTLNVASVYRTPAARAKTTKALGNWLKDLNFQFKSLSVGGDLNACCQYKYDKKFKARNGIEKKLISDLDSCGMTLLNDKVTRSACTTISNSLRYSNYSIDHLWISSDLFNQFGSKPTFGTADALGLDHKFVKVTLNFEIAPRVIVIKSHSGVKFKTLDPDNLGLIGCMKNMSNFLPQVNTEMSVDEIYALIKRNICVILNMFAKSKTGEKDEDTVFRIPLDPEVLLAVHDKKIKFKIFKKDPHEVNEIAYKKARNLARKRVTKAQKAYLFKKFDFEAKSEKNWEVIRKAMGQTGKFPLVKSIQSNGVIHQGEDVANNILAKSFSKKAKTLHDLAREKERDDPLENFKKNIDVDLILNELVNLSPPSSEWIRDYYHKKHSRAADSNGISPHNLHVMSSIFGPQIEILGKKVFLTGDLPKNRKFEFYPIWKKRKFLKFVDTSDARPIGKCCSILRPIIGSSMGQLNGHLKPVQDESQFGFVIKNSVVGLFMTLLLFIYAHEEESMFLQLFDFASAFSMLPPDILLDKLKLYKIGDKALRFFASLMEPRNTYMRLETFSSDEIKEIIGVIQGCVSGPELFKTFTNDLRSVVNTNLLLKFADDTSELIVGNFLSWMDAFEKTKESKSNIQNLTDANLLALDQQKSSIIMPIFTQKNIKIGDYENFKDQKAHHRLLGVLVDSFLTFTNHVDSIVGKLISVAKIVKSIKPLIPSACLPMAAKGMINGCLYFSAEILSICSDADIRKIQLGVNSIGRLALKRKRCEHVSNYDIYNKLSIFPIKVIICIQTLIFWRKQYDEPTHSILKESLEDSFAGTRNSSFKSQNVLSRPIKALVKNYIFYQNHCRAINVPHKKFVELSKEHLDSVFSHFKARNMIFDTCTTADKRTHKFSYPESKQRNQNYEAAIATVLGIRKRKIHEPAKSTKRKKILSSNFENFFIN